MYCRNCGLELRDGAKFCPKCGAPQSERVEKKSRKTRWYVGASGLLVLVFVACFAIFIHYSHNITTDDANIDSYPINVSDEVDTDSDNNDYSSKTMQEDSAVPLTNETEADADLYPFPERTLRYNKADMMSGDDIKYIQAALIEMNYTSLSVNGYYDLDTKDAVKRFQKNHGYSQTGVVDSEMAFNIDDALDKWRTKQNNIPELTDETAVNADLYPVPERKLYYNSEALLSGEDVKYVQAALIEMKYDGIAVTGTYDYETAAAVKRFQTNHNLTIDGIVGDQTTSALAKYLADWRNNH